MKKYRVITLSFLAVSLLFMGSCKLFKDEVENISRNFTLFCDEINSNFLMVDDFTLNGEEFDVAASEALSGTYSSELNTDPTYYYTVSQGNPVNSVQTFSGTLDQDAFIEDYNNTVEIVPDGSQWDVLVNGQNADIDGNCFYNQFSGSVNCSPDYAPVSSSACCPVDMPFHCPETNGCYSSCEAADAACSATDVIRANITGGGSTSYNCVNNNCTLLNNSDGDYASLAACQAACGGGGGPVEFVNTTITGTYQDKPWYSFILPSGVTSMEVRTKETPPDATYNHADLFVKRGSMPTCNDDPFTGYQADCASMNVNRQQDYCTFANPQAGTWYVMLYSYNGTHFESNLVVTITY